MTPPPDNHEQRAAAATRSNPVRGAILTISDTRTEQTDEGGPLIARLLEAAGHIVATRALVRDEPALIRDQLEAWLADDDLHVVLTTGGTGIGRRDTTVEIVRGLLTAELPGFGELFRMVSYQDIGSAAMLSRAVGGLVTRRPEQGGDTFVFAMPGSVNAVETAMTNLIVPQLAHLVWERRRGRD
ncbi:MAG: MogA/MoaB family molybdenum cofactor biosynthesis protein [Planctomycetota bacterium]